MPKNNLLHKRVLKFMIGFMIVIVILDIGYYFGAKSWINYEHQKNLENISKIIIHEYGKSTDANFKSMVDFYEGLEYYIYSAESKELLNSNSNTALEYNQHALDNQEGLLEYRLSKWFYYETTFSDKQLTLLVLRMNASQANKDLIILMMIGVSISLILLILLWLRCYKIIKKQFEDIQKMTQKIEKAKAGDVSFRLDMPDSNNDYQSLVAAFNEMMAEIEKTQKRKEKRLNTISDSVKTPVSSILNLTKIFAEEGEENVRKRKAILAIRRETEFIQEFVRSLIACVLGENQPLSKEEEEIRPYDLIEEIIKERKLYERDYLFTIIDESESSITGDWKKLKEAIKIYLENIIGVASHESEITLRTLDTHDDVVIEIESEISEKNYVSRGLEGISEVKKDADLALVVAEKIIRNHQGKVTRNSIFRKSIVAIRLPKNLNPKTTYHSR